MLGTSPEGLEMRPWDQKGACAHSEKDRKMNVVPYQARREI